MSLDYENSKAECLSCLRSVVNDFIQRGVDTSDVCGALTIICSDILDKEQNDMAQVDTALSNWLNYQSDSNREKLVEAAMRAPQGHPLNKQLSTFAQSSGFDSRARHELYHSAARHLGHEIVTGEYD